MLPDPADRHDPVAATRPLPTDLPEAGSARRGRWTPSRLVPRARPVLVALLAVGALGAGTAGCGSDGEADATPAREEPGAEADGPTFDSPNGEQSGQADPLDDEP